MREIFQRVEDENSFYIEVNVDADKHKDDYPWLFSVFVKFDSNDESNSQYEEFLETKESLIIALEHDGRVKYVGSRVVDEWSEFYFYSEYSKELDSMAHAILKDSGYVFESNVVKDSKWGFYEHNLFPTEEEFCHIQSDKIIFLLEEENDDLEAQHEVEHYISFDTPTQKERFIKTLDLDGFEFKDEISGDEFENAIALVKTHKVTREEVNKIVSELFAKVKEEKAYYEGWSTTLAENLEA